MAILRALLVVSLAACYEPVLTDCTVTCSSDLDCADGQTCNGQLCTRDNVVCDGEPPMTPITEDASVVSEDSTTQPPDAPSDAPAPPDGPGPGQGMLKVKISDQGVVHVPGHATCDSQLAPGDTCIYTVTLGAPLTIEAEPHEGRYFEQWRDACSGQPRFCTLIPFGDETKVEAKFRKLHGDDDD